MGSGMHFGARRTFRGAANPGGDTVHATGAGAGVVLIELYAAP